MLILPYWAGRHPDHYTTSTLAYEACFLAGLAKLGKNASPESREGASALSALPPHRPFKIIYASLYFDVRPTFVVDITDQFEPRFESLMAYRSQYSDQAPGSGLFVPNAEIRKRLETMAVSYGMLAGVQYAEPFIQKEVGLVDDVTSIAVQSI